jgi:putative peptidoglycan lipid II flippase
LAWGFTASYITFSFWVVIRAKKGEILNFPKKIEFLEVKIVMGSFWVTLRPLLILPLILQGNITLERALASLINIDVVSALDYAKFITDTVVFILSVPIAFAGLSEWSSQSVETVRKKLKNIYNWLALLVINMSFFIFFYAKDIVIFLFMRGEFNENSVIVTTQIMQGMCIGLWAQVLGYIFIKALSAHLKNKQVLVVMIIALLSNAVVNVTTYKFWGAFGLGLGNSIYSIVMFLISAWYLRILKELFPTFIKIVTGLILYIFLMHFILDGFFEFDSVLIRLIVNCLVFGAFAIFWAMIFPMYRTGFKIVLTKRIG